MSQSLEHRIERLERRQTWLLAGIAALTGFVALWLVFATTLSPKAEEPSTLRSKQLSNWKSSTPLASRVSGLARHYQMQH